MINKPLQTYLFKSTSHDPWMNQALEEYLLEQVTEEEIILYLWQNNNTVVIGKNQNAWKECRHVELEQAGGKLARRLSGGGAVYHDLGNLNFTFLLNKKNYNIGRQLSVILQAMQKLGLRAEFLGRNDLVLEGKKFSGNAYYLQRDNALHHGTILINSDLTKLSRFLQVSQEKIISKGINSIRSRVVNLSEICPTITLADVKHSLAECFVETYGGEAEEIEVDRDNPRLQQLVDKYSSWEWRFGRTPEFDMYLNRRFAWGEIELGFCFKQGHIDSVTVFSDALEVDLVNDIGLSLQGCLLQKERIVERLLNIVEPEQGQLILDVAMWLSAVDF